MSINLSAYGEVGVALCVRLDIPGAEVLRLTTFPKPISIEESDGNTYVYDQVGTLLSITDSAQELRATGNTLTVGLSGIPLEYAINIQTYRIKGSEIDIRRVFCHSVTMAPLAIAGNPAITFRGIVTNYGFQETYNEFSTDSSLTITIDCASIIDVLQTKITGRRTNKESMAYFYPGDLSFDRVALLTGKPFDFGVDPGTQGRGTTTTTVTPGSTPPGSDTIVTFERD